jgi:uncharacterized protein YlxP (DUF503 family)
MGKMFVGALRLEVFMPSSHSLKEKRSILKRMVQRTRSRYNAAASEIDNHDLWQRGTLGIACVGSSETDLRDLLERICTHLHETEGAEIIQADISMFDLP